MLIAIKWSSQQGLVVRFIKQVKVTQSYPTLCDPEIIQARILEWVAFPVTGDLPNPGIKPRSLALWADSLPASHKGSPRILEWVAYPSPADIFLTQESNWGLLHWRQILDQLSYQGSLYKAKPAINMDSVCNQILLTYQQDSNFWCLTPCLTPKYLGKILTFVWKLQYKIYK